MARRGADQDEARTRDVASLVLDARLVDTGAPAPKPGVVYQVSLMRYEILRIVSGEYPHPLIFVAHHLPDLASAGFRIGTLHRLNLTRHFPEHAAILDAFQTDVSRKMPYFCLSFEIRNT
jgi:hypothetical protein